MAAPTATTKEGHHAEDKTEIVPGPIIVDLVQADILIEKRYNKSEQGDKPMP